ncbi:MAG: hypothetical protein ACJAQT_004778 [Akkermansiaceae bacterium]
MKFLLQKHDELHESYGAQAFGIEIGFISDGLKPDLFSIGNS